MNVVKRHSYSWADFNKEQGMDNRDMTKLQLKNNLFRLDKEQLKMFYGILVHYWARYKFFISKKNLFNLWCELNYLCYEVDESFPEPYDDYELLKSFCQAHPYYFIDILPPELVVNLFCQHFDDRIDILATIAHKLGVGGLRAAYEYSNEALGLSENIDVLVSEGAEHIRLCS
jgi:hypothetical protein